MVYNIVFRILSDIYDAGFFLRSLNKSEQIDLKIPSAPLKTQLRICTSDHFEAT